jgi:hypothetical protein
MMATAVSDPFTAYGRTAANGAASPIDFAGLAAPVAERLFGSPNKHLSTKTELRFGNHGSMKVSLEDGTFYDFEKKVGGGLLDMIQHAQGGDVSGALSWLEAEGLKDPDPAPQPRERAQLFTLYYDYRDETGAIVSRVRRTPDKRFIQLGPDGNGGFHAAKGCMSGVRRVPYRLPEMLAADPNRAVFVVEGEKDADRLASLGLVATCNAEGAGKFRDEHAPHFAGRKVVIIPDNDDAGEKHAADVAAKLKGIAKVLTILRLPGLPPKGDVSDWLDARGTVEKLKELARAALEQPVATLSAANELAVPLVSATPYVWREPTAIPPRDWIYGRSILRGQNHSLHRGGLGDGHGTQPARARSARRAQAGMALESRR